MKLREAGIEGRLSPLWFMLVMSAFFLDEAGGWAARVERLLPALARRRENGEGRIFLADLPIVFPNFKLP
ncbi:MAG: hypothetical protein LBE85_11005, partial [Candidatus Accumulibacter sp.]|nr:hypothetical protein [Accumulibacter sp.]